MSSTTTSSGSLLPRAAEQYVRKTRDPFVSWDIPDTEFTYKDCPRPIQNIYKRLIELGIIQHTGWNDDHTQQTYVVPHEYRREIETVVEDNNRRTLPCNHTGFRNIDGQNFTCSFDHCDETYDRETIAEVWQ